MFFYITLSFCCIYRDNAYESSKDCNYPALSPAEGFLDPIYAFLKWRETFTNKPRGILLTQDIKMTVLHLQARRFWTGDIELPFCGVSWYFHVWSLQRAKWWLGLMSPLSSGQFIMVWKASRSKNKIKLKRRLVCEHPVLKSVRNLDWSDVFSRWWCGDADEAKTTWYYSNWFLELLMDICFETD